MPYLWQFHPLHFQTQTFQPSPTLLAIPVLRDTTSTFSTCKYMQANLLQLMSFLSQVFSEFYLLLEVCQILHLPRGGKGGKKPPSVPARLTPVDFSFHGPLVNLYTYKSRDRCCEPCIKNKPLLSFTHGLARHSDVASFPTSNVSATDCIEVRAQLTSATSKTRALLRLAKKDGKQHAGE